MKMTPMQTLTMEQNPRDAGLSGYYRQQGEGPRIVGFSPLLKGKVFSLQQLPDKEPVIVGSASSCDIRITGSTMHEYHAAIQNMEDGWVISKIDEDAELWINNEPLAFAVLEEEDLIQIGRHLFVLLF